VRYRIQGEQLSAENRLTINQLTFGDRVDSPEATSLPVRLAVALLKDRDGNIDLDLPISGTVSDPEFSVGALLWAAIGNLVMKVVTAPFTALASLGGESKADLSHVAFPPGDATLDDEDRARLDALAKALDQRPGVSVEIAGVGDPQTDREAIQRERLEHALKAAKLAAMRRADAGAALPPIAEVVIDDAERPALLAQAWRDAKRGAGAAGGRTEPGEIERLLLEHTAVGTEEVKQIAQQRAQVARDYLRDRRGIPGERLYLLAPRVAAPGDPLSPRRADFTVQ
jgi:outer membrane protein OmpA-like peptidoglycan-associated protein